MGQFGKRSLKPGSRKPRKEPAGAKKPVFKKTPAVQLQGKLSAYNRKTNPRGVTVVSRTKRRNKDGIPYVERTKSSRNPNRVATVEPQATARDVKRQAKPKKSRFRL